MTPHLLSLGLLITTLAPADLGQDERRDYSAKIVLNLEGSVWKTQDAEIGEQIWRFEHAGVLRYNNTRDGQIRTATWKQEGESLYIEFNNKFAAYREYRATVRTDALQGTASNIMDLKWTWSAKRQ
jgi:hypothetical protein